MSVEDTWKAIHRRQWEGSIKLCPECHALALPIRQESSRPAEVWFLPIRKGDTTVENPKDAETEGVFRASVAVQWIDGWVESRTLVGAALGAHA
jgi:hypothetical protein